MDFTSKKVLFVGDCNPNGYIYLRSQSIKRIVKKMDLIDVNEYINPSDRFQFSLAYRFQLSIFLKKSATRVKFPNGETFPVNPS